MTVYQKGAEVIRMYHTLLGETGFQKGMKLYFARHDGKAVTCDDFLAAIQGPDHPEHEDMIEWWGGEFDPEWFDLEDVNQALQRIR